MSDIRKANMCSRGTRAFFLAQGWDFQDFLINGLDAEKFIQTGDAMALQVVKVAQNGRKQ
ncbi:hypothetical protein MMP61_17075 [Acinetobacter sp. NIPH 1958]|uniref:hypothetical protein n=1 Tax=unclassified Acinetobacter TaxID=196816 RepID=UPI001D17C6FA|nr:MULTISPECIES: hypothetical protein [unclassified Acinetobacter]MCH7353252.1 hypothetical protein [Acinetobacter sp. NIPH 2023]MCH7357260.1 hypothetical protein [Acinetobacter sp. NIPH 1958]MCH7360634.1 hypothetical protein [Acinetobacter sp. NIPH 2024]